MLAPPDGPAEPDEGPEATLWLYPGHRRARRGSYRHNPTLPGARTRLGQESTVRRWPLLVVLALAPVWVIGILCRGAWTPDEPREADIAWRMSLQTDRTLPQLADTPFLEKPPLSYWMSAAAIEVYGDSAAAARVPNLLYAASRHSPSARWRSQWMAEPRQSSLRWSPERQSRRFESRSGLRRMPVCWRGARLHCSVRTSGFARPPGAASCSATH